MPGNQVKKLKICFIIPEYDEATPTHFKYWYDFLKILSQKSDVFLIAEKGRRAPDFLNKKDFYCQKFKFFPLRIIENFLIILFARWRGYQDFYIHYSFLSAFNASLVIKGLMGRTFYWNCGLPWLYERNFFREKFERLVYWLVTFLVTGTESLKKEYAKNYQLPISKIKIIPNWIDLEKAKSQNPKVKSSEIRKKLNIPAGAKILLFVHRLSRRKGAHLLPEIFKKLADTNLILLIIGDGPEKNNIQLLISNYQLQDRVRMLGWVPQNEILSYFATADVFILPSEEEGFPHVLLESMAAAVPFVAFDVGGVKDMIPPSSYPYLAPDKNIDLFVENIRKMLRLSDSEIDKLKNSLINWVQQYDIDKVIQRYNNLFQ